MTKPDALLPLAASVASARGWDEVTRALMLASRHLPVLDEELRTPEHAIEGCESDVWLARLSEQGESRFAAFSPSKIIRGVLSILLEQANSLPGVDVAVFDFAAYLEQLGLSRHLSQSRGNGIRHVIARLNHL